METLHKKEIAGRFEILATTITLERGARLFRQSITFRDRVTVMIHPVISQVMPIETSVFHDLAVDYVRRGAGTDMAGIRPFNFLDDFHRIDWKATARTGKLMTREFYIEKDPVIMLVVDVSHSMRAARSGAAILNLLVGEIGNLLEAIRPAASPIGLILYDDQSVVVSIEPRLGLDSRERILRTLLEIAAPVLAEEQFLGRWATAYSESGEETYALMKESVGFPWNTSNWKKFRSFARVVSPFYRLARSRYLKRLMSQGVFAAFQIILNMPEPVLVLAISDGKTNLDGLCEGAKSATIARHRVVIAMLTHSERFDPWEALSDLRRFGVRILKCSPEGLSEALNSEILEMSRARSIYTGAIR
jgi:hypothetical protein